MKNFLNNILRNSEGGGSGTGSGGNAAGGSGAGDSNAGGNSPSGGAASGGSKEGQGGGSPWFEKYDAIKNDPTNLNIASKYTSEEAAIMAGFNAQRMIGYEKVPIPKTDGDWENWYNAAGRPKDVSGYDFKKPTDLPEGFSYDDKLEAQFKDVAHKAGLNVKQATGLRDWWMETMKTGFIDGVTQQKTQREQGEASLRREYGQGYEGFVQNAQAAMKEYMTPELVGFLEQSGLGNHPEMVKVFGKIGQQLIGEGKLKAPDAQGGAASNADLDRQIADFRSEHASALMDKMNPDNKRRVQELEVLYQRRFPQQQA